MAAPYPMTFVMTRTQQVKDMLSVFDQGGAPIVLVPNEPEPSGNKPLRSCYEQGDLHRTIQEMAINDEVVFSRFREMLPVQHCEAVCFEKLTTQAAGIFSGLDTRRADFGQTVRELSRLVGSIHMNIRGRYRHRPEAAANGAKVLLGILIDICRRDTYPGGGSSLFNALIGNPTPGDRALADSIMEVLTYAFNGLRAANLWPARDPESIRNRLYEVRTTIANRIDNIGYTPKLDALLG
ncbi:MAG: hypothetical protein M1834_005502 [Cirrosporium novae-zelandiae]|nr:MAG: hypothetical protein M1834_005502 [Cirrosporium novae-zelandiae]